MEAPEVHNHHHGHSGHRWFDIAAAVCAIVVSLVSLYLAIHHGQVMQEMAEANQRMVTAASWPHVTYRSSNLNAKGESEIRLALSNKGIGPARIESMELRYKDKVLKTADEFLRECCAPEREGGRVSMTHITSTANGEVLRPGEEIDFLRVPLGKLDPAVLERINQERSNLTVKVCYCSVFDECWTTRTDRPKIEAVKACPADWSQLQG